MRQNPCDNFLYSFRAHLRRAGPDSRDVKREKRARPIAGKMNARVARRRRPGVRSGDAPLAVRQLSSRPSGGSPAARRAAAPGSPGDRPRAVPAVPPRCRTDASCPGVLRRRASSRHAKITVKGARYARVASAMALRATLECDLPRQDPAAIRRTGKEPTQTWMRPQLAGSTVAYYECCRGPTAPWQETSGTRISRHLLCEADDDTSI